jgi:hypothetical protein
VAEHGHDYRNDLDGGGWHGVMNYAGFLRPAWWWLRGDHVTEDVFTEAPAPRYSGSEMVAVMQRFRAGIPWDTALNSWTLLDSHDTARFRWVTGDRDRHLVGIGLQMTTPGVPMIFAGDEIGLDGAWGEDARRTMPWARPESWDTTLLSHYRELAALRRSSPALAHGGIRYVHVSDEAVAYVRDGAELAGLDRMIRDRIAGSGYPGQPSHPVCHGVGARAHEPPYAHQAGGGTAHEGMVLAIEPGIYWPEGGGLRLEDNFLVTADGAEKLSPFPDGIVSV